MKPQPCLREAVRIAEEIAAPYGNLGVAQHALGDFDAAAESLSRACAGVRRLPAFQIMLAEVRSEQGQLEEAEALLRATNAIDPGCTDAALAPGRVLAIDRRVACTWFPQPRVLNHSPIRLSANTQSR